MKIIRKMLHEDLRKGSWILKIVSYALSRKWAVKVVNWITDMVYKGRRPKEIDSDEVYIPSRSSDFKIRTRIYKPKDHSENLPIMVYVHGGGFIIGNPEQFDKIIERFIKVRPCIVVSPDYRLSLDAPYPAAFNDCYDTLIWAKENAQKLGATTDRIIVGGHSAGGGMTAALTLKARDTKEVDIAFQMPIYPMLDDTQPEDPARYLVSAGWDSRANRFGWACYLADLRRNGEEIPAYAAPARNSDYSDFPPTITFVGSLEPFYRETLDYVAAIKSAGVDVAFKEYNRCYHAFDQFAPGSNISKDAFDFTFKYYSEFYDKYIISQD